MAKFINNLIKIAIDTGLRIAINLMPEEEASENKTQPNNISPTVIKPEAEMETEPQVEASHNKVVVETTTTKESTLEETIDTGNVSNESTNSPEEYDTELVEFKGTTMKSRFVCGICQQNHRGDYMRAPKINPRGQIPSDEWLIAESCCKFCCSDNTWSWLPGVIDFARVARSNRVTLVVKLMSNTMHGDPEKPEHVRKYHLRTFSQIERAKKALAIFDSMIDSDSVRKVFFRKPEPSELHKLAKQWVEEHRSAEKRNEVEKRSNKIRSRIMNENFKRARNTIRDSRRTFPDFVEIWDELDALLEDTESKKLLQQNIEQLRIDIKKAVMDDDADKLVDLIAFGLATYPSIDWNKVADEAMAA